MWDLYWNTLYSALSNVKQIFIFWFFFWNLCALSGGKCINSLLISLNIDTTFFLLDNFNNLVISMYFSCTHKNLDHGLCMPELFTFLAALLSSDRRGTSYAPLSSLGFSSLVAASYITEDTTLDWMFHVHFNWKSKKYM